MKTIKQSAILLLFGLIFSFMSCKKDSGIDINLLVGKWYIYNDDPNLSVDGSVTYSFNSDKTCLIHSSDFLSGRDTTMNRSYVVGNDNTLLTLFNEENSYTEQYYIRKLTSKEMVWENASSNNKNSNKKLRREND